MNTQHNPELVQYAIDGLDNVSNTLGSELHHKLFNEDYFLIGYTKAEKWLVDNPGVFAAIGEIKDYEQDNFGEVTTDLSSSEKVVNMYVYIKGEEILRDCPTVQEKWDEELTEEDINTIKEELQKLID